MKFKVELGSFCYVVGRIAIRNATKHIICFRIRHLKSVNELTTHLLEIMWTPMKLRKLEKNRVISIVKASIRKGHRRLCIA